MQLQRLFLPERQHAQGVLSALQASLALLTASFMVLAWPAWLNHDAAIPLVPAVPGIPSLPPGIDWLLPLLILLGSLGVLGSILFPQGLRYMRAFHGALAVLIAYGCLSDLTRCHPWMYQIGWMHGLFALLPKQKFPKALLLAFGIMVAGIYFWSGFHKLNPEYPTWVLPWLLEPFGYPKGEPAGNIGYASAIFEALLGILLWIPRTRKWGFWGIVAMHTFILASIGPLGHNWNPVVWPWNLIMPYWAWLVFIRNTPTLPDWKPWLATVGVGISMIIFALLPGLHTVEAVNGYLSFSLYSGKIPEGIIFLPSNRMMELPKAARAYGEVSGDNAYTYISGWTLEATGLSPFPSAHYFKQTYQVLCQRYPVLHDSYMIIKIPIGGKEKHIEVRCGD